MKLIMTKGLPGSGKSTWAKQLSRNNQQYMRVNKDSLREMMGYTLHRENAVVAMRDACIRVGLKAGKNVIVDDTNLDPKHEFNLRKLANECGAEFELNDSFLQVPLKTCIKQDLKRLESVGKDVILKMHKAYLAPKASNASELQGTHNTEWLDVIIDGRMVQINGKGEIREIPRA